MANTLKALNIREKTKPALPENDPGETGYQLYNGGGGGSRISLPTKTVFE
jgi:hypothetical protein